MKLLLDVGNTSTTWGLSHQHTLMQKGHLDTHPLTSLGSRLLTQTSEQLMVPVDEVWVASVVRGATPVLERTFGTKKLKRILPTTVPGVNNITLEPEKVGVDRLVNVKAALKEHAPPFVILDTGTAITLCAVNEQSQYCGGAILPGLRLSRDVLSEKTSLLPSIEIRAPERAIGRNTEEALVSGIVLAASHAIRGLFRDFSKELSQKKINFIGTGGNITLLAPLIPELTVIDPDLTLKGIEWVAYE
jgi:type III pantothenate kinase